MSQDGEPAALPYVVDGHNDLPWAARDLCDYDLDILDLAGGTPKLQTDIPRLRAGGVGAQFWSVYVPGRLQGDAAVTATLEQIDFVRRLVATHPDHLALARTAEEIQTAVGQGRIASLMGMEGGHSIDCSLGTLRMMHALGVRYLTLTHNQNVPWADSATDEPVHGGLTDFGHAVVREMNAIGMFVDLSHVSDDVMRQALDTSTAPVIFSHSCARAVTDISRNVPDDVLARLASNGGVCMVAFPPMFVSQPVADWYLETLRIVESQGGDPRDFAQVDPELRRRFDAEPPPRPTVGDVADHVDHVRAVAGLDHVGLGGDYDGATYFPAGMEDVSGYPMLFTELRSRGWSDDELGRLAHGNLLRAMRGMEDVARR